MAQPARGTYTSRQGKGTLAVVENIFQELFTQGRGLQLEVGMEF